MPSLLSRILADMQPLSSWFGRLKKSLMHRRARRGTQSSRGTRIFRPRLERLEEREVPAHFFQVTGFADGIGAVDFSPAGTSSDPYLATTLRAAVLAANADPGSTIVLPDGTYTLTLGTSTTMGELPITRGMTVTSTSPTTTTIQQTIAGDRIFDIDPNLTGGVNFSLFGVTLTGGSDGAPGGSTGVGNGYTGPAYNTVGKGGGAILLNGGSGGNSLLVHNDAFTNNSTTGNLASGGAINVGSFGSQITVTHSSFVNNSVGPTTAISGGGAIATNFGSGTITDDVFINNKALAGAGGGALFLQGSDTVTFNRFVGNTAATAANGNTILESNGSTLAVDNWWGGNTGPSANAIASINSGSVSASAWLIQTFTASTVPDTFDSSTNTVSIQIGNASPTLSTFATLTVDFIHDNAGSNVSASDPEGDFPAFTGMPITFHGTNNGFIGSFDSFFRPGGRSFATYIGFTPTNAPDTTTVTVTDGLPGGHTFTTATNDAINVYSPAIIFNFAGPSSTTTNAGQNATFGAEATSNPAAIVIWQISTDGGTTFNDLTLGGIYSANTTTDTSFPSRIFISSTLTITGATAALNQDQYRAIYRNTIPGAATPSNVATGAATLTVLYAPAITLNPANSSIDAGQNTSFTAAATNNFASNVVWQISTNGGSTFNNFVISAPYSVNTTTDSSNPAAILTTSVLTITNAPGGLNGFEYRAVFSNSVNSATTLAATLFERFPPTVILDPSNLTVDAGSPATFTAAAADGNPTPTTVKWQADSGGGFTDLSNGGIYSGVATTTLTISPTSASLNGNKFRAVFSNAAGMSATTNAAVLTVISAFTFVSPPPTFPVGDLPISVAVGDLNGDGFPDLAVLNNGSVSVLVNQTAVGSLTTAFAPQQTFAVGNSGLNGGIALADFNGDGRPDIVVTNTSNSTISVLLNLTASGASTVSFSPQTTIALAPFGSPVGIAVADINGDGRPDVAVTDNEYDSVDIVLNTTPAGSSTPTFSPVQLFGAGAATGVALADLNGDGRPDVVITNSYNNTISVLGNTTAPGATAASFANQQTYATGGNFAFSVAAADFNGDGRTDLAVSNSRSSNVGVLFNMTADHSSTFSFAPATTYALGTANTDRKLVIGDFNGDAKPDIAAASDIGNTMSILLNTTPDHAITPSFAAQANFLFSTGNLPWGAAVGDFNFDGRSDLVVTDRGANTVSVLLNSTTSVGVTQPIEVADFPGYGVSQFNRFTGLWQQITPVDPIIFDDAPNGNVVAAFAGYGVAQYKPNVGWTWITGAVPTMVLMDLNGDVFGEFPGYGVQEWKYSTGWRRLSVPDASQLAIDGYGDVAGVFANGVNLYRSSTSQWSLIAPVNPNLLTMNINGAIVANFVGYGLMERQLGGGPWTTLTTANPDAVAIDTNGNVVADFAHYGIDQFLPWLQVNGVNPWIQLTSTNPSLFTLDHYGRLYADFPGYGFQIISLGRILVTNPITVTSVILAIGDWQSYLESPY